MAIKEKTCQEKKFRRFEVWMIANKATSTPLNPKSKMQNQGGEDWVQEHYLVLLVKMQELRNFDVFFFVVFFVFFFFGVKRERKKKSQNSSQKPNFSILVQSGVPGAIYSLWHTSQGLAHLVGPSGQVGGPTMEVRLCGGYLSFGYGGSAREVLWWSEL